MLMELYILFIGPPRVNGHSKHHGHSYDSSTILSSDIDTTSFFDTDDDSRFSTVTDTTNRTASKYGRQKRRQRRKHRMPPISRVKYHIYYRSSTQGYTKHREVKWFCRDNHIIFTELTYHLQSRLRTMEILWEKS